MAIFYLNIFKIYIFFNYDFIYLKYKGCANTSFFCFKLIET